MGPVEALQMAAEQKLTGLKRAVVDTERLSRGADPIPIPERQREEKVVQAAEDKIDSDPTVAPSLVSKIVDQGERAITEQEAATLLVERQRLMNERRSWEEKIGNGEDVEVGKSRLEEIEGELDRLDRAQRTAGTTWGRLGHMYQRLIREDFTLEAMESKMRAAKGEKLTPEERAKIREQASKIKELQDKLDERRAEAQEKAELQDLKYFYERTISEIQKEAASQPKVSKTVLDIAKKIVDTLDKRADAARQRIRERTKRASANVDPTVVLDVAEIMASHIGHLGLKFAEVSARILEEFGNEFKPYLKKSWVEAKKIVESQGKEDEQAGKPKTEVRKAKDVVKKGTPKESPTVDQAKAKAKAEATAQEPLSHQTVFDLAKAHIKAGIHGEDSVMAAVFSDLKDVYPGLTERDVRRAFSEYGKAKFPNKEATATELRELRALTRMQESIDRLKEGRDALRTGLQRDKATEAIREKQKQLNELLKSRQGPPSPEKLASMDEARQTALRNRIAEIEKELSTGERPPERGETLRSAKTEDLMMERDALMEKLREVRESEQPVKIPEESYNERRLKQVQNRIQELQQKISAGDFTRKQKPTQYPKTKEVRDAEFALEKEKQTFNKGLFEAELQKRSPVRKGVDFVRDILNTSRAVMTSFDLSAVLRQGGFITLAHPIRALKAFPAMFKALASEKGQFGVNQEIQNRPNADLYKQSKLFLNDPHDYRLSKMEEAYMSRWASKIPGVAHSERAYTTFLNKLRADSFDAMADAVGNGRSITPEEGKAIANFVNVATGRGNLAGAAGAAVSLNTAFFSPRFVLSRFELLAGQPLYHGTAATRIAVAKEYARYLIALGTVYALAKASGAQIETDPRSADFGKIRFGNTRVDMLSGLAQSTVLASRLTSGQTKTPSGELKSIRGEKLPFGRPDAADVAGRFLRTKLSPAIGGTIDIASGRDVMGNPVTPGSAIARLAVPLSFTDVYGALKDQGMSRGTAISLLGILGAGVQVQNQKRSLGPNTSSN